MKSKLRQLTTAAIVSAALNSAPAAVRYVDVNSANPTPPYSDWSTAATNIQNAVDAALAGDEVVVTNGVYRTGGKAVDFINSRVAIDKPLTVHSVNGPQLTTIEGASRTRCTLLQNGAFLAGFTLTNGNVGASSGSGGGGGVFFSDAASAIVSNCVIIGCTAVAGGGAASASAFGSPPDLIGGTLVNCTFANNQATGVPGFPVIQLADGGAAHSCRLINCIITNNGISLESSSGGSGGGAYKSILLNCLLAGNSSSIPWAQGPGGGAALSSLVNCTVVQNTGGLGGGVYACSVTNSIVYDNSGDNHASNNFVAWSCTTPMPENGIGNITNAPLFADPANGNFRLQLNSPCINAGNNNYVSSFVDLDGAERIVGGTVDMGAYEWIDRPTHYVSLTSPNPTPPYLSWSTAATNIQDAVDRALPTGVIHRVLVTNGLYQPGRVSFGLGSARWPNRLTVRFPVWVESVNGPEVTFIQGTGTRCVYIGNSIATSSARLSGFTLAGGTTYPGIVPADPNASLGGGVFCSFPATVVSNCVVRQCTGGWGGGASGGTLVNCTVISNSAWGGGGGAYGSILHHCMLSDNLATNTFDGGGGALGCNLFDCTVKRNSAGTWLDQNGGGAYKCFLQNSVLSENTAYSGGGAGKSTLVNCTIISNTAAIGGGVWRSFAKNSILYYNTTTLDAFYAGPNYSRGDLEAYAPEGHLDFCCTPIDPNFLLGLGISYTNIFYAIIEAEPRFIDLSAGNLRLQSISPCINAGNNAYIAASTDLDGRPRILSGRVDIGAYEFVQPFNDWLQQYGLPTDGSADFTDFDNDGLNNFQESVAGTNPTNSVSTLQMLSPTTDSSGVVVRWQSVTDRFYFLERSTNLALGSFSSVATSIAGQSGTTSFTDTNAPVTEPSFYRIGVQQ